MPGEFAVDMSRPAGSVRERGVLFCFSCIMGLATLLGRAVPPAQPIVENYVGRQIPTAMVARNLERGSGFFYPQLDTAPFPNYFVVEPPLYQSWVIALRQVSGWTLPSCGRLISALCSGLAAAALLWLVGRREPMGIAPVAGLIFLTLPVEMRYGRAFQPDAFALGLVLAGLACWSEAVSDELRSSTLKGSLAALGFILVALGLAARLLLFFLLVPIAYALGRRRPGQWGVLAATLIPGIAWQVWGYFLSQAGGSRASLDNRSIWLSGGLAIWLDPRFLAQVGWAFGVRAFSPLALGLAVWGLGRPLCSTDRLWLVWASASLAALFFMGPKLHHEYYWLPLAPAICVGAARIVVQAAIRHAVLGFGCLLLPQIILSGLLARPALENPPEWREIEAAGQAVSAAVPESDLVIAPEALLFYADRRGCRLEWTESAIRRAAGEWGESLSSAAPIDLVEFYRRQGAHWFADLTGEPDPRRLALHEAVRQRYKVLRDSPSYLIADLSAPEKTDHGP